MDLALKPAKHFGMKTKKKTDYKNKQEFDKECVQEILAIQEPKTCSWGSMANQKAKDRQKLAKLKEQQ